MRLDHGAEALLDGFGHERPMAPEARTRVADAASCAATLSLAADHPEEQEVVHLATRRFVASSAFLLPVLPLFIRQSALSFQNLILSTFSSCPRLSRASTPCSFPGPVRSYVSRARRSTRPCAWCDADPGPTSRSLDPGPAAHRFTLRCARDKHHHPPTHPRREPFQSPLLLRGAERRQALSSCPRQRKQVYAVCAT